ncbi:MAG: GPP34 family phosphoprotein [Clostridioides sp.]|jgi:hypothetical protein|nr:GPP34 family phosphoprotein [Clostridioides sp.]
MKHLSYTQKFFLCALKPQGSTALINSYESAICLLAGGLLELLTDGIVCLDEKNRVLINKKLPPEKLYLTAIYEIIEESKSIKIEKLVDKHYNRRKQDELFESIGMSIVGGGYVTEEIHRGLFRDKIFFTPNGRAVTEVVEDIRIEVLIKEEVPAEIVVLGALLNKSRLLKKYFSKYEVERLRWRLRDVKRSDGALLKRMVDCIDNCSACALLPAII